MISLFQKYARFSDKTLTIQRTTKPPNQQQHSMIPLCIYTIVFFFSYSDMSLQYTRNTRSEKLKDIWFQRTLAHAMRLTRCHCSFDYFCFVHGIFMRIQTFKCFMWILTPHEKPVLFYCLQAPINRPMLSANSSTLEFPHHTSRLELHVQMWIACQISRGRT